jgi:hypothetical protein
VRATYVTVADAGYFLGLVALLNSLRLTGNDGELVVIDCGLTGSQRAELGSNCTLVPVPVDAKTPRPLYTPFVATLAPAGVLLFIDSDAVVTGRLDSFVEAAASGRVCAFPDPTADRRCPEWAATLRLRAPLRQGQTYVSTCCLAFSTDHWPGLLPRWREACELVPGAGELTAYRPWESAQADPFYYLDQDAVNALLMSELPAEALMLWDRELAPWTGDSGSVRVTDRTNLRCLHRGRETLVLHAAGGPKPWDRLGWSGSLFDAVVEVLPRLLLAPDVPVRVRRRDVPRWLRGGRLGPVLFRTLRLTADASRWTLRRLPAPLARRLLSRARAGVWRSRFRSSG